MGAPQMPGEGAPQSSGTTWLKCGCIGCAVVFLMGILGGGACFYGIVKVIKASDAYQMTERLAKENPIVREHLGEVTGFGFMPSGNVNKNADGGGEADLSISVTGTKGSGTLEITARSAGGQWKFTSATLELPDGRTFPLLASGGEGAEQPEPSTGTTTAP